MQTFSTDNAAFSIINNLPESDEVSNECSSKTSPIKWSTWALLKLFLVAGAPSKFLHHVGFKVSSEF